MELTLGFGIFPFYVSFDVIKSQPDDIHARFVSKEMLQSTKYLMRCREVNESRGGVEIAQRQFFG